MNEVEEAGGTPEEKIRAVINDFLQERLEPKLDPILKKEEKIKEDHENGKQLDELEKQRTKLLFEFSPEVWIDNAARRVSQLQQATHAVKYMHPDAKGTSLNEPGNPDAGDLAVGTHTIACHYKPDVVGNAAVLDVYKFLSLQVNGKTMLGLMLDRDPALRNALSDDAEKAESWINSFAAITDCQDDPASHKLAKQVYWPLGEGAYHLLAPLFPTSLCHEIREKINEDRFSEEAKAAREARKNGESHPNGYREYPECVLQKFGGSKPQNISQLNTERGGEIYLLASCPPNWRSEPARPPLFVKSVFDNLFGKRRRVRELTRVLRDFLLKVRDYNNIRIREKRSELVGYIRDELLLFAAEIQDIEPGWSLDENCRLNPDEQCWLDPWRAQDDEAFAALRNQGEWKDAVCKRFGNWLNARLTAKSLNMGEDEAREWQSVLDKELRTMRMEVDIND